MKELLFKLDEAQKVVDNILLNDLQRLPYFNDTNFKKNFTSLKRVLLTNPLPFSLSIGFYDSTTNQVVIDSTKINEDTPLETLEIMLLHEHIHMASADLQRQVIGLSNDALPSTYNEAATQYLTLKLFYKNQDIRTILKKNFLYNESVIIFSKMVDELTEEVIFDGFFEANVRKCIEKMPNDVKSRWIDYLLIFKNTPEETCLINMHEMLKQQKM